MEIEEKKYPSTKSIASRLPYEDYIEFAADAAAEGMNINDYLYKVVKERHSKDHETLYKLAEVNDEQAELIQKLKNEISLFKNEMARLNKMISQYSNDRTRIENQDISTIIKWFFQKLLENMEGKPELRQLRYKMYEHLEDYVETNKYPRVYLYDVIKTNWDGSVAARQKYLD